MKAALIHIDPESSSRPIIDMRVELEGGRIVRAGSSLGTTPPVDAKIVVTEYVTWYGWKYLTWDGALQ